MEMRMRSTENNGKRRYTMMNEKGRRDGDEKQIDEDNGRQDKKLI